jgi:hypothetical protein
MDIGSIFLILAILVPVLVFIFRPLMERDIRTRPQARQDLSALLAERDQVVSAIQELDDDYNLGKIPEEMYPARRQLLLHNGADILRQIDAHQPGVVESAAVNRLETAIATRMIDQGAPITAARKNGGAVPPVPDDDLEQRIASRRRERQGKAGGFCPKCGKPVQAIDRFCPRCGVTLD